MLPNCYMRSLLRYMINHHKDSITQLFKRGGRIDIIIPDDTCDELMKLICQRFQGQEIDSIKNKVKNTSTKLNDLRLESGSKKAKLNVYKTTTVTCLPL
jgi:hypothetical protein